MDTGAKIKQLRESLDMTQEDLGKLLGVKKAAINKYETGTVVNLKRSTIENLCNIFNVTPQYLLSDSDLSQPSSSMQLTEQEATLLLAFRKLNGDGKTKVIEYTKDLSKIEKYDSSPIKESLKYPSFGAAPLLAAEAGSEYSSDLEAQLRKDADEIVREEYKKAVKLKSGAK